MTIDTLYYDGSCPLCAKEMRWLARYHHRGLALQDIHALEQDALPAPKAEMLQILHLYTATGELLLGLDATVTAWSHTPYGFLVKPLQWPIIKTIADKAYQYWAIRRYAKRYDCNVCQ
jgi:predicted DCC family thiol-disulfide oxidoreductase YuxK